MALGIKLFIDKGSVKDASSELNKKKKINKKDVKKDTSENGSDKDKKSGGAFGGALLGGLLGSIIGQLEPIKDLLGIVAGVLKIALTPILILMKPFLIILLKMAIMVMKWLKGPASKIGKGVEEGGVSGGFEAAADVVQGDSGVLGTLMKALGILLIGLIGIFTVFAIAFTVTVGLVVAAVFLLIAAIIVFWDEIVSLFVWMWESLKARWMFFLSIIIWMGKAIVNHVKKVLSFFKELGIIFLEALSVLGGFGQMIWDKLVSVITNSLKVLANIGSWIKKAIIGFFGGGGSSSSHQDVLITSNGDVHDFAPDDNIMAFKSFDTPGKVSGGNGGSNVTIIVEGSVWSEGDLADVVAKKLNEGSRGSTANY